MDEQKPEPEWRTDRGATRIKILDEGRTGDGNIYLNILDH